MKVALVQRAIPASIGVQDFTDSNISSDWKAAIFFGSNASSNNVVASSARMGLGATDGINERAHGIAAADGVTTTQVSGVNVAGTSALVVATAGGAAASASFDSVLANGVRLNWTDIDAAQLVNGLLLSGADVEVRAVTQTLSTGTSPVTTSVSHGLSAAPDIVIAFAYLSATRVGAGFYDRSANTYAAVSYTNLSGQSGGSALGGYVSNNAIIRQVSNSASEYALTLSNFTASTFDAVATGTIQADSITFVSLRISNGIYKVGVATLPTATGNAVVVTGMAAQPSLLLMFPSRITAVNSFDGGDGAGTFGLAAICNNHGSTQQMCSVLSSDDGAATTSETSYTSNTKALVILDTAGNADVEATHAAWTADGVSLNFSNVSGAFLVPYLAVGVGAVGSGYWAVQEPNTPGVGGHFFGGGAQCW